MKHVLIIDDVMTNLKVISEILKDNYQISTAKSGKIALLMLKEITPDIILLDINMPDMDGFEVMAKIKSDQDLKHIPIILLTAETDQEWEAKGLKLGAMDFIRKPFEPEVISSRIDKVIYLKDQNQELKDIAQKDSLTELHNRRYMENLLNNPDSDLKQGFFLLLDMDNFKQVNDNFGHLIGDEVLIRFAGVMKEEVSEEDCVCRIGGDEFAIFIAHKYDDDKIRGIARRMIAGVEFEANNLLSDACDFKVSVSIGIARRPEDGKDFSDLYACADKALYYVKQNNKRGYHFFTGKDSAGYDDMAEENNQIDLLQLQRLIQEKEIKEGAYKVEYDGFKRIYHFVSRCMERKSQDIQLVLFTINADESSKNEKKSVDQAMPILEEAISKCLRRGDVATKCGNAQFVAILINASSENGNMIARRIAKKFEELQGDDSISLVYEMQSVNKKSE